MERKCYIYRVVEELRKNNRAHLACHGPPNPTMSFESVFVLRDGHFLGCDLKNPEIVCLCHTTVGDEESLVEVIHLASAMQFAGFCGGAMWAVDDGGRV